MGILIGFCLSFAVGAHAEVISMIGKTVEGVVDLTINGKKMEYQAIMIDGTTYAPVRMLAEETGNVVRYDPTTGVKLVKKIIGTTDSVYKQIESINLAIVTNETIKALNEENIQKYRKEQQTDTIVARIKSSEAEIERLNKSTANLTNQIAKLKQTLVEIAAQEAELNPPTEPAPTPTEPTPPTQP